MIKSSRDRCPWVRRYTWIFQGFLALVFGLGIGFVLGHFLMRRGLLRKQGGTSLLKEECVTHTSWNHIIDKVDTDRLKQNLRELASEPHVAGLPRDDELVYAIRNRWHRDGLDTVQIYSYEVLLSHPDPRRPNKVYVLDKYNRTLYVSRHMEEELRQEDLKNMLHSFNAYAPSGRVQGKLVFVNYAQKEDFQQLKKKGIDVKGLICLTRYGKIFRGNQLLNAYEEGAKGILFYSDPKEVAPLGMEPEQVYPNTIFMPPTGMQRGSVYMGSGDPLTPSWPSLDGAYRIHLNKTGLPKIPAQPIGYSDALYLIKLLGGESAPGEWEGFNNSNIGPGFRELDEAKEVRLEVRNTMGPYVVRNVIGKIEGSVEPDRYVILGNHRDAWGFGASDPSSGTAQLLETVRIFGELKRDGWRPRRTLIFASWAAEEYGIVGSQEWVEELGTVLASRGVALINTDTCVSGPNLELSASPLLYKLAASATKKVRSHGSINTLYTDWRKSKGVADSVEDWALISSPGAGTDEAPFSFYVGIPSVDIWFQSAARKEHNMSIYPAYHTAYDTFHLIEQFVDPLFRIHKACSQLAITMLLELAESLLLPFDVRDLAKAINRAYASVKERESFLRQYVALGNLTVAINTFTRVANLWQKKFEEETKDGCISSIRARILNDQMMQIERALILPQGLPGAPTNRHVVFSPTSFDAYGGGGFPGLVDLVYRLIHNSGNDTRQQQIINLLKKHVSDIMVQVVQATHVLRSF